MTEQDRDYLLWKHARGRYSEGGRHYGAKAPREGGILSPEYRASAVNKNAQAMYRADGAVVSSAEPEPEGMDTVPYAPPRMERIAGESKDAPDPSTVMDFEPIAEVPEDVYTPPFMFAPAAR